MLLEPRRPPLPELHHPAGSQLIPPWHLAFVCTLTLAFTYALLFHLKHETADEGFHTPQIWDFYNGKFKLADELTMFPAYHATIAGVLAALDVFSVKLARLINLLLSATTLPMFYLLARRAGDPAPDLKLLLFATCPIVLPLFGVVYTDLPALTAALAMVYFTLGGRTWLAALVGLVAILMRQTNLIWVGFCGLWLLAEAWDGRDRSLVASAWAALRDSFKSLLPLGLLVVLVFGIFLYTGTIVQGDAEQHRISFNPSNLYFYLLLAFFMLLPLNFAYLEKVIAAVKSRPWIWAVLALCWLFYLASYHNDHQYNSPGLDFYLRNILLHYTVDYPVIKALTFIPIAWMGLTFYCLALDQPRKHVPLLLYGVMIISIVPLPLIEQRYYLVSHALLLALIQVRSRPTLGATLFLYVPINAAVIYLISAHRAFL